MSNSGRAGRQTPTAYGNPIAGAIRVETTASLLFGSVLGTLSDLLYDGTLNPVGVDFDPEEVLARYRAGESRSTLLQRVTEGPHNPAAMPRAYLGTFHWLMFKVATLLRRQPGAG